MLIIQPRNHWSQWTATVIIRSQSKVLLKLIASFLQILLICILFSVFPITSLVALLIRAPRVFLPQHSIDSLCSKCLFLLWVVELQQQRKIMVIVVVVVEGQSEKLRQKVNSFVVIFSAIFLFSPLLACRGV